MLWDRGTYELLGDMPRRRTTCARRFQVSICTAKSSRGDFAIVRMKRGKGNEWLLLKKKDASAQPGWDTEDHARSVLTGRTQEEIASRRPGQPKPSAAVNDPKSRRRKLRCREHLADARADRQRHASRRRRLALRSEVGRRPRPLLHPGRPASAWFRATAM